MKTLFINGKFLSQATTGVQRYAANVVEAWDQALDDGRIDPLAYSIRLIVPRTDRRIPPFKRIQIIPSLSKGKLWEQVELPVRSAGGLLFSPYAAAPVMKSRHIVTIHDAGVAVTPQQYSMLFRIISAAVYRALGSSCISIITVSQFSKQELHKYFAIPLDKMTVIPPSCDHLLTVPASQEIIDRFGLKRGEFILGVSSKSPIKNFAGLVRAWELLGRPEVKLAIAGKTNSRVFRSEGATREGNGVVSLGYVSDSELRALYESAGAFVYPSFYEGFGLPPLEAMSCGCPVIVADSSALPESCGDAAIYCDPTSPEDIANKIGSLIGNPALSDHMRMLGRARVAKFTSRETAMLLWSQIEKHIEQP